MISRMLFYITSTALETRPITFITAVAYTQEKRGVRVRHIGSIKTKFQGIFIDVLKKGGTWAKYAFLKASCP